MRAVDLCSPEASTERQTQRAGLRVCLLFKPRALPRSVSSWPNTARLADINLLSAPNNMDWAWVTFLNKSLSGLLYLEINPEAVNQSGFVFFVSAGSRTHKVQTKSWVKTVKVFLRLCLLNRPGDFQTTHPVGPPTLTIYWRVWLLNRSHSLRLWEELSFLKLQRASNKFITVCDRRQLEPTYSFRVGVCLCCRGICCVSLL